MIINYIKQQINIILLIIQQPTLHLSLQFYSPSTEEYIYITQHRILKMWNLKCSNRILDLRIKKQAHQRHLKALKSVKSRLNISRPKKYSFLQYKAKSILKQKQRTKQIQRHNSLLVNRMITMPSYVSNIGEVYTKQSLNSIYLRKRDSSIDNQNKKIVTRLQSANSKYSQQAMGKSVKIYYQARSNMATSKMDQFYDFQNLNVNSVGIKRSFIQSQHQIDDSNNDNADRQKSKVIGSRQHVKTHENNHDQLEQNHEYQINEYKQGKDTQYLKKYKIEQRQGKEVSHLPVHMRLNRNVNNGGSLNVNNRKFRPFSAKK